MRPIPLGGDQLTCERMHVAHMTLIDGYTPEERLEGLFTMNEDFHEKNEISSTKSATNVSTGS